VRAVQQVDGAQVEVEPEMAGDREDLERRGEGGAAWSFSMSIPPFF
jgi:hypothetical protein